MGNTSKILSIGELNQVLSDLITESFDTVWVRGEISNFKSYPSGHWYFKLKDDQSQINGVMFRGRNSGVDFAPKDGDQVEVAAQINFYAPRGEINLNVQVMRRAGAGALFEAFLKLKQKLEREGLFDPQRKKPIPKIPRAIGIITSSQAAALKDVLSTLARRASFIPIVIYPTPVQGVDAPAGILRALDVAQNAQEVDVLLLVRGGGSIEDLWAFNDETLARKIAQSFIPIISGVGHETDFTIADFVADLRAPTPTAAAELAAPDASELLYQLHNQDQYLQRILLTRLEREAQRLDHLLLRLQHTIPNPKQMREQQTVLQMRLMRAMDEKLRMGAMQLQYFKTRLDANSPAKRWAQETQALQKLHLWLGLSVQSRQQKVRSELAHLKSQMDALSPQRTLERGYSLILKQGIAQRDPKELNPSTPYEVRMALGDAQIEFNKIGLDVKN